MAGAWIRFRDASVAKIDDDLSSWELIDGSEDEEMVDYSYDGEEDDIFVLESPSSDLSADSSAQDLIDRARVIEDLVRHDLVKQVTIVEHCDYNQYDHYRDVDEDEEEEEEEEDDDDDDDEGYGYDLDDELVPRSVSDRFERQRMRKLGKRAYPKMNKSKRLPYSFNRPGCVHGKHGLGMKHNISL